MKKTITLKCLNCGKSFEKELAEYNRQIKKDNHKFFCSNSCAAKYNNQKLKNKRKKKFVLYVKKKL